MDLVEFDAKNLLRDAGLPVPAGTVLQADESPADRRPAIVKAQVPFGGRGKRGLVIAADADSLDATIDTVRTRMREAGYSPPVVLLEVPQAHVGECYLAWRIDDVAQDYVLLFSTQGGVDVEHNATAMHELHVSPQQAPGAHDFLQFLIGAGLSGKTLAAACRFAVGAWRVFVQSDAHLLEINPLAIGADGGVIALDAKITLDDNAASRHRERERMHSARLARLGLTDLERRAADARINFIELPGEVAVLSGGAGLGMALLDLLEEAGMPAANFVDISGGSPPAVSALRQDLVFELASRDHVKVLLMYITVAASSLAKHVNTLAASLDRAPPPKPMIIGLLCGGAAERDMTFEEARQIFESRGYRCARDLRELFAALTALRDGSPSPA